MKKLLTLTIVAGSAIGMATACSKPVEKNILEQKHEDGVYRGSFIDGNVNQIGLQFTLKDNVITVISYRSFMYSGCDYSKATPAEAGIYGGTCSATTEVFDARKVLYNAAMNNLKDKNISYVASYNKGIVSDVAGSTANARFNKIRHAVIDGLLHGKYE